MDDLISRQAAIDSLLDALYDLDEHDSDGYYPYCSECMNEPQNRIMTDYCPNCGAYMKGESNDKTTSN